MKTAEPICEGSGLVQADEAGAFRFIGDHGPHVVAVKYAHSGAVQAVAQQFPQDVAVKGIFAYLKEGLDEIWVEKRGIARRGGPDLGLHICIHTEKAPRGDL